MDCLLYYPHIPTRPLVSEVCRESFGGVKTSFSATSDPHPWAHIVGFVLGPGGEHFAKGLGPITDVKGKDHCSPFRKGGCLFEGRLEDDGIRCGTLRHFPSVVVNQEICFFELNRGRASRPENAARSPKSDMAWALYY